ncbi:hypothetical protein Pla175_22540 [Pirellulimonas nuda]|uniref:Uncharacterized protein n=1 Tax=Pirellulimonas nuda TaxID=2528009 RepID=A0A518DBN1_9BACT|nr:PEP-CTERM sorting domain-containing protein [Pirellulimonas nuda]QDU88870.1 hypothetical protein Pla175_22540 [Pirellulimonas nuda]
MSRLLRFQSALLSVCLALLGQTSIVQGQASITWTGAGNGSTFSDDNNWFAVDALGSGVLGPEFQFPGDSLKFDSAGTTINNDLDPTTNPGYASPFVVPAGQPLQLGNGYLDNNGDPATNEAVETNSAAFHFLPGAGNFTITGFAVKVGGNVDNGVTVVNDHTPIFRAEAGAGMLQTFDIDMTLGGGLKRRKVVLKNSVYADPLVTTTVPIQYASVVFNGDINFVNDVMFIDEQSGRVELNGNNTGVGSTLVTGGTNSSRAVIRNNIANTILSLGSDTALGEAGTGVWDDGTLQLRGLTANAIVTIESPAERDLSGYFMNVANASGGGGGRFDSGSDISIGYLMRSGNGTRTVVNYGSGVLNIEGGIFATTGDAASSNGFGIFANGPGGTNGKIVVNGRLFNTFIDPIAAGLSGTSATGGILTPIAGADGVTMVNASINFRNGAVELNGDSSASWIGSQVVASNNVVVTLGHTSALGDSTSVLALNNTGTVDIGALTIEQRVISNGGTLRGNGTLTYASDWSIGGTVQPGSESPTASDTLTFDFSGAVANNTLQFAASSTVDFVLDAGLSSSTIDVVGSLAGGTNVVFNDNTFALADLTSGALALGDYTLFNGDANTTYTLGAGVTVAAPTGYSGSLSVSGNDLILSLAGAGGTPGDYNEDGVVDAADYTTWRDNLGSTTALPNDGGLGTPIGSSQYDLWRSNFGNPGVGALATGSAAVPEPSAVILLGLGGLLLVRRRMA